MCLHAFLVNMILYSLSQGSFFLSVMHNTHSCTIYSVSDQSLGTALETHCALYSQECKHTLEDES